MGVQQLSDVVVDDDDDDDDDDDVDDNVESVRESR